MTTRLENLEAMLEEMQEVWFAEDLILPSQRRWLGEIKVSIQALRDLIPCVKALKALIETIESVTTGACDVDAGLTDGRRALQQFESGSVPPSGDPSVER